MMPCEPAPPNVLYLTRAMWNSTPGESPRSFSALRAAVSLRAIPPISKINNAARAVLSMYRILESERSRVNYERRKAQMGQEDNISGMTFKRGCAANEKLKFMYCRGGL